MAKKSKNNAEISSPRHHIEKLIEWMAQGVYEKDQTIAMALLCAIAGENIFLLGPPGTAKSLIASRLKRVFKDARSFDYLMSRFSTPDEIFGPVSIARLKNEDRYERLTEGYLPEAHIVFLDEIWKAGPSIQNTLLTVINEHVFHNGGRAVETPMKVLIAASNELPAKDEGLEALWDRFLVRMVSNPIESESSFLKMIQGDATILAPLAESLYITDQLYDSWQEQSKGIGISREAVDAIKALRKSLATREKEDANSLRFYVSDRRWRKAFRLMQVSAFLNGRPEIDLSDFLLLAHCFWNDVEAIPSILDAFGESIADAFSKKISKIDRTIRQLLTPKAAGQPSGEKAPKTPKFAEVDYFYYQIEGYPDGITYFAKWGYEALGTTPIEGIKYYDNTRHKTIIQPINPSSPIDLNALNTTNIIPVRIEKWANGAIIDGKTYQFRTVEEENESQRPFIARGRELTQQFDEIVEQWQQMISTKLSSTDNIFLSPSDLQILDKMRTSVILR